MCHVCSSPEVRFKCGMCGAWEFCSEQCAHDVAQEHLAVCYDAKSDDLNITKKTINHCLKVLFYAFQDNFLMK